MSVNRNVYQTSKGGKTYVPLEASARIVSCATPHFAKMIASKYARLKAGEVVADLKDNHDRSTSRATLQRIADCVGAIAAAKEQSWSHETPKLDQAISSVVCSLDGDEDQLLERLYYHADSVSNLRDGVFTGKFFDSRVVTLGATSQVVGYTGV